MTSVLLTCGFLSATSVIGVYAPYVLPAASPHLATIRPFGTGVVLSIALIHLLPDALEATEKIEMPAWAGEFPLAQGLMVLGFVLMVCFEQIFACPCDVIVAGCDDKVIGHCHHSSSCPPPEVTYGTNGTKNEKSTLLLLSSDEVDESSPSARELYKMYMLEVSIAVHSILVGLPVTATSCNTLIMALGFHQLFEGMSLGLAGLSVGMSGKEFFKLAMLFGSSISIGIVSGYYASGLSEGGWQGFTNSIAAGIVLFVAFEFYQKDFGHDGMASGAKVGKLISFLTGATLLAVLSIWA